LLCGPCWYFSSAQVSSIIAVGTFGTALAATLVGTGIGLVSGCLIDTLAGLGTLEYQSRVEYLVIVDGTDDEVLRESILVSRTQVKCGFAKPVRSGVLGLNGNSIK